LLKNAFTPLRNPFEYYLFNFVGWITRLNAKYTLKGKTLMTKLFVILLSLTIFFCPAAVFGSEAKIERFCKKNYGKKRTTYERCVLSQKGAKKYIERTRVDDSIKQYCKKLKMNRKNWVKLKYCIATQENAKAKIEASNANILLKDSCEKYHGENWISQKNCVFSVMRFIKENRF
jgi:hypothetical protein